MATILTDNKHYQDIANAIRAKGANGTFKPSEMANAITTLPSGSSLNLAYGLTAPEDTSKIWVKIQNEPEKVSVKSSFGGIRDVYIRGAGTANRNACEVSAAAYGDKIYIFGGGTSIAGYGYSSANLDVFDTNTGEYSTTSYLFNNVYPYGASVIGSKIYVPTFDSGPKIFYPTYDPITNEINALSSKQSKSNSRGVSAISMGKYIYMFGGANNPYTASSVSSNGSSEIYIYDSENDTYQSLSTGLPSDRAFLCGAAIGESIYLFGGYSRRSRVSYIYTEIYKFSTSTQTITKVGDLPAVRAYASAAAIGDKIYIFGGSESSANYNGVNTIYMFDTTTNSCVDTGITLPYVLIASQAVTVGKKIYLIMGYSGSSATNSILEFSGTTDVPQNELQLIVGYGSSSSKIISSGSADIDLSIKLALLGDANGEGHPVEVYQYINSEWTKVV